MASDTDVLLLFERKKNNIYMTHTSLQKHTRKKSKTLLKIQYEILFVLNKHTARNGRVKWLVI